MSGVIKLASRYVQKMPEAISGEGGHNRLYRVACILVNGFSLNDEDALEVLREYNERCIPEWTEKELIHKLDSARKANHRYPEGYLIKKKKPIVHKLDVSRFLKRYE